MAERPGGGDSYTVIRTACPVLAPKKRRFTTSHYARITGNTPPVWPGCASNRKGAGARRQRSDVRIVSGALEKGVPGVRGLWRVNSSEATTSIRGRRLQSLGDQIGRIAGAFETGHGVHEFVAGGTRLVGTPGQFAVENLAPPVDRPIDG
jgi:hypothetical protein